MNELQFLHYEEVNKRLEALINNPSNKIAVKKEQPLGKTDFLLPINHYTIGSGPKHIVVTGSYHAAEIITTTFVVRLMEDLAMNPGDFNPEEYTIDFIPIMNPEGYLITTETQKLYLEQGNTEEEKIALAKDYWRINRQDAINTANASRVLKNPDASNEEKENALKVLRGKKGYQALYDSIKEEEFLKDYPDLKANVMAILQKNNYDIGVCAAWTSNGHGVDLSQNVPFNSNIEIYKKGPAYSGTAYSNIRKDTPGPINCPCRDINDFSFEKENLHLLNFLCNLDSTKGVEVSAFINYHSIMGKMYQRPVKEEGMIDLYHIDYFKKLSENYIGARTFREENAYDIVEGEDPYNYINEYLRIRFGINIQPELSRMGGNPIGPLADPETFENVTIKPNLKAFRNFVSNLSFIKEYASFINYLVTEFNQKREQNNEPSLDPKDIYRLIDKICQENPSLYIRLRDEIKNHHSYNSHVITYFYSLIAESLQKGYETENSNIKDIVSGKSLNNDLFLNSFSEFIRNLIIRLNNDRIKRNLESLTEEQINNLVDNIILDYPELFSRLKTAINTPNYNKEVSELYNHLETIINNQIKMGNLIK